VSLGQSDLGGCVFKGHPLRYQKHGLGAFDQSDGHGGRAHPRSKLLLFLIGKQDDQGRFSTLHYPLMGFRQCRAMP
jgi:hypothetical protein